MAVANQPRQWGERLQRMAQLEDTALLWLTSSEVGSVLPKPPLLEAARRKMSIEAHDCLYLSCVSASLDTAKHIGMATAYFAVDTKNIKETKHPTVTSFANVFKKP